MKLEVDRKIFRRLAGVSYFPAFGVCSGPVDWNNPQLQDLNCVFNGVYNTVIAAVGVVFVIWGIMAGIKWVTAGGDEKAVADARRGFMMAILGFIGVVGAYAIINIVGNLIGGVDFPGFVMPGPDTPAP